MKGRGKLAKKPKGKKKRARVADSGRMKELTKRAPGILRLNTPRAAFSSAAATFNDLPNSHVALF